MDYSTSEQKILAFVEQADPVSIRKRAKVSLVCATCGVGILVADAIVGHRRTDLWKQLGFSIVLGSAFGLMYGHLCYQANVASLVRKLRNGE